MCLCAVDRSKHAIGLSRFALVVTLAWTYEDDLFWRYVGLRLDIAADRVLFSSCYSCFDVCWLDLGLIRCLVV